MTSIGYSSRAPSRSVRVAVERRRCPRCAGKLIVRYSFGNAKCNRRWEALAGTLWCLGCAWHSGCTCPDDALTRLSGCRCLPEEPGARVQAWYTRMQKELDAYGP